MIPVDPSSQPPTELLIQEAVKLYSHDEVDWDTFTELATAIGNSGVEGVEATAVYLSQGDAQQRFAAAELIGRMSFEGSPAVVERCFGVLAESLQAEIGAVPDQDAPETNSEFVASIVSALGQLEDPRAVPPLLGLASHESELVRFSLALALPAVCDEDSESAVTETLVALTSDSDEGVRDWACFGLGQMQVDTPPVRDAMAARLSDPHEDTRCEALVALARLGDERAYDMLSTRLTGDDVWTLEVEAAGELGDPRLHPALVTLREWWADEEDAEKVDFALRRCDPGAKDAATAQEQAFLAALRTSEVTSSLNIETQGEYPFTRVSVKEGNELLDEFRLWDDEDPFTFNPEDAAESQLATLEELLEPA